VWTDTRRFASIRLPPTRSGSTRSMETYRNGPRTVGSAPTRELLRTARPGPPVTAAAVSSGADPGKALRPTFVRAAVLGTRPHVATTAPVSGWPERSPREVDLSRGTGSIELCRITTAPDLVFDALASGPADGPFVLLLHGFAESFHTWQAQLAVLAQA